MSPHRIRRSAITAILGADVEKDVTSGRCNVSRNGLGEHYDARSEEQKRARRQRQLEDSF